MQLFYSSNIIDGCITLSDEESRHCIKVLRKRKGDNIHVTDGTGNLYNASIVDDNSIACIVSISSVLEQYQASAYKIHLAIAPTKNPARFEWLLEKLVEIGVDEITPLICEHSEKQKVRIDRLEKIIVSAMKQSLNYKLPILHEPVVYANFIDSVQASQRFICWCETGKEQHIIHSCKKNIDTVILVGPEGDFSKQEVDKAIAKQFVPVSLGKQRYRTETAGLVATQLVHFINSVG